MKSTTKLKSTTTISSVILLLAMKLKVQLFTTNIWRQMYPILTSYPSQSDAFLYVELKFTSACFL